MHNTIPNVQDSIIFEYIYIFISLFITMQQIQILKTNLFGSSKLTLEKIVLLPPNPISFFFIEKID